MVALMNKTFEVQVYPRDDSDQAHWEQYEPTFDDVDIFHSLLVTGKKISAIKYLRSAAGAVFTASAGGKPMSVSLKSAKEAVETMAHDNHWHRLDVPEGPGFGVPLGDLRQPDGAYGTFQIVCYPVGGGNGRVLDTYTTYNAAQEAIRFDHHDEISEAGFVTVVRQVSSFVKEWKEIKS